MGKGPLVILIELVSWMMEDTIEDTKRFMTKVGELFFAVLETIKYNFFAFLIGFSIFFVVFIFAVKTIIKTSGALVKLGLILLILLGVLILLSLLI
ncbi:MAG: hypothetical protein J7L39_01775 [Candidatus Aenigmarchaeota archaeon]|nr:hypothetical protein [Candidatus Aenigmarchaeota archaeon]